MLIVIGLAIVLGSVLGGFLPHGDLRVLWQPLEVLIIVGAALGAFIIANPLSVQLGVLKSLKVLFRDAPHPKAAYLELLTLLYTLFKLARSKGMLALETHVEHPYESELFRRFPHFVDNHHAVEFLCDYLRLISLGAEKAHEIEELMAADLATHHAEMEQIAGSLTTMSDGLPAFGIVAAVLGIIIAMGSLGEPPEELGRHVAAALTGTFLGVLIAYGLIAPIGNKLRSYFAAQAKYHECIKAGLLAFVQGYAPVVAVEFARKALYSHERPSFTEVEEAVTKVPAAA
jgi:chemotaxis protein MotA